MLLELRVKNLGIIADISWRLRDGLNVITGETGTGKSLVIDAVETLLSAKTDEEIIRHGADEAEIEGVFTLPQEKCSLIRKLLVEKDLVADDDILVISCTLRQHGADIIRINGNAVSKALLRQIGGLLVDIHGQSEHLSLLDQKLHLDFLDAYANTQDLRSKFGIKATTLEKMEKDLTLLDMDERDNIRREEFLRFQLNEINHAQLQKGEDEELERESIILTEAEKIRRLSYETYQALYGEDGPQHSMPALDKLNEALHAMDKLVQLDPALKEHLDFLEEAIQGITDVAQIIRNYIDKRDYDPNRLEEIESRLEFIRSLKRKYGQSISEILDYRIMAEGELSTFVHYAERKDQLKKQCLGLREEMGQIAHRLSQRRVKAAKQLVTAVKHELYDLNMSEVDFKISVKQEQNQEGIPLTTEMNYSFNKDGIDNVEFMVATNPGEPLKPLTKIASTGEISRFTLALKGALSEANEIPVLVFDEIDIGIGGRNGEIVGKKLWILARQCQVVCVTHLPQIAAFSDAHFSISKETPKDRTLSTIRNLDEESRIKELAAMLVGPKYTKVAINNARELIQKAEDWKFHN